MKATKQALERVKYRNMEFGGYVASRTQKGVQYFVRKVKGEWFCDCTAGQMRQQCFHIQKMAEKLGEGEKCFYCGTTYYAAGGLDRHHVYRRSTHPELIDDPRNIMLLCRRDHDRATVNPEFEQQLQQIWELKNK